MLPPSIKIGRAHRANPTHYALWLLPAFRKVTKKVNSPSFSILYARNKIETENEGLGETSQIDLRRYMCMHVILCVGVAIRLFVTEAFPLVSYFMKRHSLTERWEVPRGRLLFPSGLCLSAISRVVWAWPDPLPTRLKRVGKKMNRPYGGRS